MRIAYVGNFEPEWSTENDVRKAFEYLGHEVVKLQENALDTETLRAVAFSSDLLLWTGTWDNVLPLRDVVDILRECSIRNVPTATLHLDIFFGTGRGGRHWWAEPMFQTRYVFTADGGHQDEWKKMGIDHYWLRPAIRHDAAHFGNFREEYACDVAFVGSNGIGYHEDVWPYRRQLVDNLRDMCARNGWSWKNPGGDDPKVERNEDRNDFYASAKVTVGDSLCLQGAETNYCSDRAYEAPGCGGLLIMPQLNFLKEDYHRELCMYPWNDFENLEGQIRELLADDRIRNHIRETTQSIVAKEHTYVNRVQELLKIVGLE